MSEKPIVRTTTRVPATYEDVHEDWTAEKIRECFGDDPSCIVVPLLNKVEALERQRDALAEALRQCQDWIADRRYGEEWPEDIFDGSQRHLIRISDALLVELEGKG